MNASRSSNWSLRRDSSSWNHVGPLRNGWCRVDETKLTEQFSPQVYDLDSKPAYRRYSEASSGPFDQARLEQVTDSR